MNRPFVRILVWLGIMTALTLAAMGLWFAFDGDTGSTASLKWLQFVQTCGTFLLPPIVVGWLWSENKNPLSWLKLDIGFSWQTACLAVLTMVCSVPAINLLAELNGQIHLPKSLESVEQILRAQEDAAAALTERFLKADNIGGLLINIGLLALLPAMAEELSFRGTLQQILFGQKSKVERQKHTAIWVTAFVFSAIHMQFYGFVPRMLMGAMFGYVFVWTGSLWVPVLMHFTNNAVAVVSYYVMANSEAGEEANLLDKSWADTIGTGNMWWLGVLSLIAVILLLYLLKKQTKQYEGNIN